MAILIIQILLNKNIVEMMDKTFIGDKQDDVTVFELIDENTNFMGRIISIQFCRTCQ